MFNMWVLQYRNNVRSLRKQMKVDFLNYQEDMFNKDPSSKKVPWLAKKKVTPVNFQKEHSYFQ